MAKILTVPVGSPYYPKPSTLGTISNYNATNRTWEATGINTSMIRNKIGAGTNGFGALSVLSNLINPFALFHPDYASPHNAGEFLGYNHDALPPTYFIGKQSSMDIKLTASLKITIPFLLDRGERPPYMDDVATTWDRVKVIIKRLSGDLINIDDYKVAPVYGQSVGNTTPQHILEIQAPTNDYYDVTISVNAFYCEGGYANIRPIEDTHPNITLSIEPYFLNMYLRIAQMGSSGSVRHHYNDGQHTPTYEYASGVVYLDNSYNPVFALATPSIINAISPTVYYGGYYLPYAYSDCLTNGEWRIIGQLNNTGISIGDEYKSQEGIWYKIAEIESGYYAYIC